MSSTPDSRKKHKTASEIEAFDRLREHILQFPGLAPDSRAVTAALAGLDEERKRLERDLKLQEKFSRVTATESAPASVSASNSADGVVVLHGDGTPADHMNEDPNNSEQTRSPRVKEASDDADENTDMLDWQDVETKDDVGDEDSGTSFLGRKLAKLAVESLARHNVRVRSPVAALAAAIHASMRTDLLGFAGTGIPDDPNARTGGFAAPIRELPPTQLLPSGWDNNDSAIHLRYRKSGLGSVVLSVTKDAASDNVTVQLTPTSAREPPTGSLKFALHDHINLESWNAAKSSGSFVPPALHYKCLAAMLANFIQSFDLGSLPGETAMSETGTPYVDATITRSMESGQHNFVPSSGTPRVPRPSVPPVGGMNPDIAPHPSRPTVPSTIGEAFPMRHPSRDFPDDLTPAGLIRPDFGIGPGMPGGMAGNQMGPGHPMFVGGGGGGLTPNMPLRGGPGTMQPRFDPFGPPGGPQDPNSTRGSSQQGRRRHPGEPNPDHLPPPNGFNDSMFS